MTLARSFDIVAAANTKLIVPDVSPGVNQQRPRRRPGLVCSARDRSPDNASVASLSRIHNDALYDVNMSQGIVFVARDLQRQQLGVDAGPKGTLVFFALTDPLRHTSDTANVVGDLRDHLLGAGG
jgi:hypothetical protein